jgi:hypothetical protein
MRMSGEIGSARQAIQVLSVKIGEVLLVLGGLYLANIGFLARIRRRTQVQAFQSGPAASRPGPGLPQPRLPEMVPPLPAATAPPGAGTRDARAAADTTTADAQAGLASQAGQAGLADLAGQAGQASSRDQGLWRPRPRQALH